MHEYRIFPSPVARSDALRVVAHYMHSGQSGVSGWLAVHTTGKGGLFGKEIDLEKIF